MSAVLISLVLGVLLLLGGLALARWFVGADPRLLATAARTVGIAVLVVIFAGLALTGRLGWMIGLLPLILPLLWRRSGWGGRWSGGLGGLGGGGPASSGVRTAYLDMHLDHGSGSLDGQVLQGAHAGRRLSQLMLAELLALLRSIDGADRKSALLLEAYLDRRFPDWRQGEETTGTGAGAHEPGDGAGAASPAGGPMTHDDALRILGLAPGASAAEIKAAHLRLIAIVHPDRGGSPFLAAQVNRARDVLLGSAARS